MGQRGKETEVSEQATCKVCGLTARTKDELEAHVHQAHGNANSNEVSSEQKIDPFPWVLLTTVCYWLALLT